MYHDSAGFPSSLSKQTCSRQTPSQLFDRVPLGRTSPKTSHPADCHSITIITPSTNTAPLLTDRPDRSYVIEGAPGPSSPKICFLTLAEKGYPRRFAFDYLDDLQKEFLQLHGQQIESVERPYKFITFGECSM